MARAPHNMRSSIQPAQADVQNLMMLMQGKKFGKAETKARKLIKKFPSALVLYDVMSGAQFASQNFNGVVKTLTKALEIQPDFVDGEYNLAMAYMNLDRLPEALEHFDNVIVRKPNFFEAYNNRGAVLVELQRFDEAIESYKKAIELKSDFVPALRNLGAALRDMGKLEEAEGYLAKIPFIQPRFALGHLSLGVAQQGLGKTEKAISSFEAAIKLNPEMHQAHYELGKIYKSQGKLEEALTFFEKVDNLVARVQVLETLYALGRKDELLPRLAELNSNEPKNLRAAAFSAFVSQQYGVDNTHAFCPDPLSFVSVRNIRSHIEENPDLLEQLMNSADDLATVWEHNTTKGGTQTHGNLFDPALENENFALLEKIVRKELRGYREELKGRDDVLLKAFPKNFQLRGWRVKLMKAGFQKPHIHSGGWVSGVLYLKVPKNMKDNDGSIAFSLHGYDYHKEREDVPYKEHLPSEGELVLFPSSLFHWTIPFDSDEERQCIAFDVVPA